MFTRFAVASTLAVPALLAFSGNQAATIEFAPKAGSSLTKTIVATTSMEMDDMAMTMNGEPSPMMPDIEMSMEVVNTTTVTDEYVALGDGMPKKLARTFDAVGSELEMDVVINMMGEEEAQSPNGSGTSELEGSTVVFTWNDDDGEYELSFPEGEEGDAELLEGLTEDMDFRALLPDGELSEGESYDIDLAGLVDVMAPGGDLKIEMEVDGADGAAMGPDPAMMSDFRQFFEDVVEGSATGKFVEMREVDGVNVAVIELEMEVTASADMADMAADVMGGEELPAEMSIDRLDLNMSMEGTGELLWNVAAGHVHGLSLQADLEVGMDMAMGMDMGGQSMDLGMEMAMSGTIKTEVTTQ
jgi:hypothetical protein